MEEDRNFTIVDIVLTPIVRQIPDNNRAEMYPLPGVPPYGLQKFVQSTAANSE